jgi:hypothetical protein
MAQALTLIFVLAALGIAAWFVRTTWLRTETVAVRLRLDHTGPGAHLMWDIGNLGQTAITVTRLVIRARSERTDPVAHNVDMHTPQVLQPQERALLPTDVDWTLLSATSMAVCDAEGREHLVSQSQLKAIQEQLGSLIERRDYAPSAKDWLSGAADMAVGVVILGLGFFMLMWVIATG